MPINNNIISRTVGDSTDISQTFIQNNIPEIEEINTEPILFRVPLFRLQGATFNFYEQVIDGISVNLNNQKSLQYTYTANTSSFSAITRVVYDVYRVNFDVYDEVINNLDSEGDEVASVTSTTANVQTIANLLATPLITIYETGDTISLPNHTINLPEVVKPTGMFAEQLLNDKAQYFIDTKYEFPQERDRTLGAFQILSGGVATDIDITTSGLTGFGVDESGDFLLQTANDTHIITGGTFSGITVNGAIFTYFVAPQKPNIDVVDEAPTVIGELDTFSPIFSFNNVDDGDYYKLQVSYDTNDESFSAATVFTIPQQEGIPDFIRTFSVPLSPDSAFIYRIGNTKEIENVFGVKQNVTTWGRIESALTATDGLFTVNGTIYQNEFFGSPVSATTVAFLVTFTTSSVELGADAATDEEIAGGTFEPLGGGVGTVFSAITDENGYYEIENVKGGNLNVTLSNPYYTTTAGSIVVGSDVSDAEFTIVLAWGNDFTTFEYVKGQLFV